MNAPPENIAFECLLRADYGPTFTPLMSFPPFVHCKGLPKMLTFRGGDAAARAVSGPLTETRRRTKTGSGLGRGRVCGVLASCERGTIISL